MGKLLAFLLGLVFAIAVAVFIDSILAFAVEALWNGVLVRVVSGVKEVDFWQAFGLLLLCGFLFKPVVNNASSK